MTEAVRAAMRQLAKNGALEHAGLTTGDINKTRARARDAFRPFEGADGLHVRA